MNTTAPQPSAQQFEQHMREAQGWHSSGWYTEANEMWQAAQDVAPNQLEAARALRGRAQSTFRIGERNNSVPLLDFGQDLAREAYGAHLDQLGDLSNYWNPETWPVRRQVLESGRVLGRMMLTRALDSESLTGRQSPFLDEALGIFTQAATKGALDRDHQEMPLDQHDLNFLPDFAICFALANGNDKLGKDQWSAAELVKRAWQVVWKAESSRVANSANLGTKHQLKAVIKAVGRTSAATAINVLATPKEGLRRRLAVRIARLPHVL